MAHAFVKATSVRGEQNANTNILKNAILVTKFESKSSKKTASGEHSILTDLLSRWEAEKHYNPRAKHAPEGCVAPLPESPGTKKNGPKIDKTKTKNRRESSHYSTAVRVLLLARIMRLAAGCICFFY